MPRPTILRATVELIFAGAAWGFGFVATVIALKSLTPLEVLFWRFLLAASVGIIIYLVTNRKSTHSMRDFLPVPAVIGGLLLGVTLLLQTWGLKYTTATNSGFLTTLYIVEVPVIATFWLRHKIQRLQYFAIFLAIVGTGLMVEVHKMQINPGDSLAVACSVFAALHIVYLGKISNKIANVFHFNNIQSACALFLVTLFYVPSGPKASTFNLETILCLLFLGLIASLVAFTLQVRSQQVLSPTTSSLLFLLESPFAAFFGWLLLAEKISLYQLIGALIILAAGALAIHGETKV